MDYRPSVTDVEPAFIDERGAITNIIDQVVEHIAIILSVKGSRRADHYHPIQEQWLYCVSGGWKGTFEQVDTKERVEHTVEAGQLEYCPPLWAHTYEYLEDTMFLNITTGDRDAGHFDEHTIKYVLQTA